MRRSRSCSRPRRPSSRFGVLILALTALTGLSNTAIAKLKLPRVPADRNFSQDYSRLLEPDAKARIGRFQKESFELYETPIMVVTIQSMAKYGGGSYSIERFASEWFNKWQLGKLGRQKELVNKGILLLVSVSDRRARIELGADWGRDWDGHCARIMNNDIVPKFKTGDFPGGIEAGVTKLAEISKVGPSASPPSDITGALKSKPLSTTPLPMWAIGGMMLIGIILIVLSFYMPQHRKTLLITGICLVVGALILWVVLGILAMMARGRGGSTSGGFASGGGFSTGGFSGGGGATGSW